MSDANGGYCWETGGHTCQRLVRREAEIERLKGLIQEAYDVGHGVGVEKEPIWESGNNYKDNDEYRALMKRVNP